METVSKTDKHSPTFPEKIFAVNYAGYWELQDGEYYEDTRVLHEDEYKTAPEFAEEVCKRYNSHYELLEALKKLYMAVYAGNSVSLEDAIHRAPKSDLFEQEIIAAIKKATE